MKMRTGRPRLAEDVRLAHALTVRFTRLEYDALRARASAAGDPPTTALRRIVLEGAGLATADPSAEARGELRDVGRQLARLADRLRPRRRQPTSDDLAETRAAVAACSRAVAVAIVKLSPRAAEE